RGWLRTGDLGELDSDGNLRFRGRKRNVIVTPAGLNIFPEDLEQVLRRQTGVRDCVVIPLERGGNAEPCAVLLLEHAAAGSGERIVAATNHELAEFQRIHTWLVWPDFDFPRTPTGKAKLAEIRIRATELLSVAHGASEPSAALAEGSTLRGLLSQI